MLTRIAEHRHAHLHLQKRELVVDTVTVIATAPADVVYVDPEGHILYTSHANNNNVNVAAVPTPAPAAPQQNQAPAASYSNWAKPSKQPKPPPKNTPSTTAQAVPTTAKATSAPPKTSVAGNGGGFIGQPSPSPSASPAGGSGDFAGYGLSYSPYAADGTCLSQDQVNTDFAKMPKVGIVRSYGVDCNQATTMLNAAKANGMKLFAGIFDINAASDEIKTLIDAVNKDWSSVWAVSIGNEDVNQGKTDAGTVVAALNAGRQQLRAAGFNGPVVHVDTFNQVLDHPELCENSDFAAANCHAFFDPNTAADKAGDFVSTQAQAVSKACGGKTTWITETGWPHAGDTNGQAVPSPADQQTALDSIRSKMKSNAILFSAFNTDWKQNGPGTFNAEHNWGIINTGLSGY